MVDLTSLSQIAQIATNTSISPQGAEAVAEVSGQYQGETVHGASETEKLADAAEELGMSHAEHRDRESIEERHVRMGRGTNIEALARIADYYDKLPDMPEEAKLLALVERLTDFLENSRGEGGGSGASLSKDDIFRALQEFDLDVSHQFAALEVVAEYFAGVDAELDAAIADARREFEQEDLAREVRAGFAVAQIAHETSALLGTDPATYRETYRRMLRDKKHMGQLFDDLRDFDRSQKFEEIVQSFLEAVGSDLSNASPTMDPLFLNALIVELAKLKQIHSVYQFTTAQLQRLAAFLSAGEKTALDRDILTSRLLHFCARPSPSVADAMAMQEPLAQATPRTKVLFANSIKSLYDLVPDNVLPSVNARESQNAALLDWMSVLVQADEAATTRQS